MLLRLIPGVLAVILLSSPAQADGRDGLLFDQGAEMTAPADRASEETAKFAFMRGAWEVSFTHFAEGSAVHTTAAHASTTIMNRGHGYLERYVCEDFDGEGHARHTVSFLVHVPSTGQWNLGIADSWSESIAVYSGGFEQDRFVVETIDRRGGSGALIHRRIVVTRVSDDAFTMLAESGEYGGDLLPVWQRSYERQEEVAALLVGEGYGEAAPGLPSEAQQFDFLLGEWDLNHEMTFPNGQTAKWAARGTGVRILGGHAIMESNWFDVDPNVPDASTTIVRVYNRVMRRWESMYCANRFNNILYFGGVKEGDQIVLHSFEKDAADARFSYWIFHSMTDDSYGWYANTSQDRGATFQKTWIIEGARKVGTPGF